VVGKLYFVNVFSMFEIKLEKKKKKKTKKKNLEMLQLV